jgi:hypothetical protein
VRDAAAPEPRAALLEYLEGQDADEPEDDVFTLDDPVEAGDEDEEEDVLDSDDDE